MSFSFEKTIASMWHHIYESPWNKAKAGDKVAIELKTKKESLEIDPYACVVKIKSKCFEKLITAGHIAPEIFRHAATFLY